MNELTLSFAGRGVLKHRGFFVSVFILVLNFVASLSGQEDTDFTVVQFGQVSTYTIEQNDDFFILPVQRPGFVATFDVSFNRGATPDRQPPQLRLGCATDDGTLFSDQSAFFFFDEENALATLLDHNSETGVETWRMIAGLDTSIAPQDTLRPVVFGRASQTGSDIFFFFESPFENPDNGSRTLRSLTTAGFNNNWVFAGGLTSVEFELVVTDTVFPGQVSVFGPGIGAATVADTSAFVTSPKFEDPEDYEAYIANQSSGGVQSYTVSFTAYRRDASESTRDFRVNVWFPDGEYQSIQLSANLSGDALPDNSPPQIVGAPRWMTKGDDPTYLDLYPLYGRSAVTNLFVQVDVEDESAVGAFDTQVFLDNPLQLPGTFIPFGFLQNLKGDWSSGTFGGSLFVQNDIDWSAFEDGTTAELKVLVRDVWGQSTVEKIGDVCLYGPDFDLVSLDDEAPVLMAASINEGNPLLLEGEVPIVNFPATLSATDNRKRLFSAFLTYSSPSELDSFSLSVNPSQVSNGNPLDGAYESLVSLGRFFEAGEYSLTGVVLTDAGGNFSATTVDELSVAVQKSVTVVNPLADTFFPTMESPVLITPSTTVDESSGAEELIFTFSLKDIGTGITGGTVTLFHCDDPSIVPVVGAFNPLFDTSLIAGTLNDGTFSVTLSVPSGQPSGEYTYQISVADGAGRTSRFGKAFFFGIPSEEPGPLPDGSPETVTVISPTVEDTTGPVLTNISIVCDDDLGVDSGIMSITLDIESDITPLLDIGGGFGPDTNFISLISPTGATQIVRPFSSADLVTGDLFDGTFSFDIPLPRGLEGGDYCVQLVLQNTANVESAYGLGVGRLPFPNDFPGVWTFLNSGVVDCAPPVPIELTVTPGVVTQGGDVNLIVSLRIIDSGTGIQSGNFSLLNGISGPLGFRNSLFTTSLTNPVDDPKGEGTVNDATYSMEIPLTGGSFGGDFLSFRLTLFDASGNSRIYDSSICNYNFSAFPFPYNVVQIGTEGNAPPSITSDGGGEMAALDVNTNSIGVTTVTASDSDFPPDQLIFSISGGADMDRFEIQGGTGILVFKAAPDFANPTDANTDNVYEVIVQVDDQNGGIDTQEISVAIVNVDENDPPVIVSDGGDSTASVVVENGETAVTTVQAADIDIPANTLTFTIVGGADASLFDINSSTGELSFKSAPDFGNPSDANGDNQYQVTVEVSDDGDPVGSDSQAITVIVLGDVLDEEDYLAYANSANSPFPVTATVQQIAFDFDFDRDTKSNGEEWAAGSDPTDINDFFWSMILEDSNGQTLLVFSPYKPQSQVYTFQKVFQGSANDAVEEVDVNIQPVEGEEVGSVVLSEELLNDERALYRVSVQPVGR